MKLWLLVLLLVLTGCASTPDYRAAQFSAVRLELDAGVCSGTAVGPYTILSAEHCFGFPAGSLIVNGERTDYLVIANDGKDHVLIRVTNRQKRFARLGPEPRQGDIVFVHGNPDKQPDILRVGRVAGFRDGATLYDINGWYGDSGAAVFDSRGRIVGVVSAMFPWPNHGWRLVMSLDLAFTPEQWARAREARP